MFNILSTLLRVSFSQTLCGPLEQGVRRRGRTFLGGWSPSIFLHRGLLLWYQESLLSPVQYWLCESEYVTRRSI